MMSAAQYYPKLLSIMGNVLRFLPAFVRMKELLEEGFVGELLVCEAQVGPDLHPRMAAVASTYGILERSSCQLYGKLSFDVFPYRSTVEAFWGRSTTGAAMT